MRPTQCVSGLYLPVADSLAPLPINSNNNKIFRRSPIAENKIGLRKFSVRRFLAFSNKISTVQKIVLSSSRGQGNFQGVEASRPRPRTSKCVLVHVLEDSTSGDEAGSYQRWRRGHNLRGQGQKCSRPRPITQKKIRGQGQGPTSRGQGQECSRPRPRSKDSRRKCSPKKRSPKKFSRRPQKKRSSPEKTPNFCKKSGALRK